MFVENLYSQNESKSYSFFFSTEIITNTGTCIIQGVSICLNRFPEFFVQALKIVVDSWKFSMLLLYIF